MSYLPDLARRCLKFGRDLDAGALHPVLADQRSRVLVSECATVPGYSAGRLYLFALSLREREPDPDRRQRWAAVVAAIADRIISPDAAEEGGSNR